MSVYGTNDDLYIQMLLWGVAFPPAPMFKVKWDEVIRRDALSSFTPDFPMNKHRQKIINEIWEKTHNGETKQNDP